MLISPSEPAAIRALGTTCDIPERHGCDVLFVAHGGYWGVQRKELKDFVASVNDDRLGKDANVAPVNRLRLGEGGLTLLLLLERTKQHGWKMNVVRERIRTRPMDEDVLLGSDTAFFAEYFVKRAKWKPVKWDGE